MKHSTFTRAIALLFLAAAPAALSQTPALVSYQGRVQTGTPPADFTGNGQFKFALIAGTANISVAATATATRTGSFITDYTVVNQGAGYITAPVVTVTGGGGSGATATAVLTGDKVTAITPVNGGTGYTGTPNVNIAAPPPRQQSLWNNNGTITADPVNAVSLTVNGGLYSVLLGDTSLTNMLAIPPSAFARPDVRLRVWFNGQQLSPDQRLAPNGYLPGGTTVNGNFESTGTVRATAFVGDGSALTGLGLGAWSRNGANIYYNTGNVGIGTTTPTSPLAISTINDGISVSDPANVHYCNLALVGGEGYFSLDASINDIVLRTIGGGKLLLQTGQFQSGICIAGNNNVGIGTATPTFKLDVNGGIRCVGAVNTSSDARYKKDIRPVSGALETIVALHGVSYDWNRAAFPAKDFPSGRSLGFIAQEVEKVLPEAVSKDSDGYYSVAYSEVIPVLVEATKQIKKENDELRARLTALEARDQARDAQLATLMKFMEGKSGRAEEAGVATVSIVK